MWTPCFYTDKFVSNLAYLALIKIFNIDDGVVLIGPYKLSDQFVEKCWVSPQQKEQKTHKNIIAEK